MFIILIKSCLIVPFQQLLQLHICNVYLAKVWVSLTFIWSFHWSYYVVILFLSYTYLSTPAIAPISMDLNDSKDYTCCLKSKETFHKILEIGCKTLLHLTAFNFMFHRCVIQMAVWSSSTLLKYAILTEKGKFKGCRGWHYFLDINNYHQLCVSQQEVNELVLFTVGLDVLFLCYACVTSTYFDMSTDAASLGLSLTRR